MQAECYAAAIILPARRVPAPHAISLRRLCRNYYNRIASLPSLKPVVAISHFYKLLPKAYPLNKSARLRSHPPLQTLLPRLPGTSSSVLFALKFACIQITVLYIAIVKIRSHGRHYRNISLIYYFHLRNLLQLHVPNKIVRLLNLSRILYYIRCAYRYNTESVSHCTHFLSTGLCAL